MRTLKELLLNFISNFGFSLIRHQIFYKNNYGKLAAPENKKNIPKHIAEKIMHFYQQVPPFYSDDIIEPLKIQGAWKGNILNGRKEQLDAIKTHDTSKYQKLLDNMFRNEMIYAMWEGSYFKDQMIGKRLPPLFLEWMDGYKFLTGRVENELIYESGGAPWGYHAPQGVIKLIDPAQGIKAHNIINLIKLLPTKPNKPVICDLGSGFGGDMEKVARWYNAPMRIILIDIPLNLTTAYAYIAQGFENAELHLIESEAQLDNVLKSNNNKLEFIFVPTIFVEKLKHQKIHILHNHGSFSEMDAITINYYLKTLLKEDTDFMVEINSNKPAILAKSHTEVASSCFDIPSTHSLFMRTPTWITAKGHRYLNSVYINKETIKISEKTTVCTSIQTE